MSDMKVITIIIPTYNMEKYLHKCLDSLIVSDENMKRLEVLVVNDGSKDSSLSIAREYAEKYPQTFAVIDKENGNYGSCINRGLREATGRYVKVLDADDYFDSAVFNEFITFLNNHDVDMVISDFKIVNENGEGIVDYRFGQLGNDVFTLGHIPTPMIEDLWHHAITYNRNVFSGLEYKQTEGISYTDDEWIFEPLVNVKKIVCFPYVLYMYLRGREGQTFDVKIIQKTLNHKRIVAKKMIKFYEKNCNDCPPDIKKYMMDKLLFRLGEMYRYHYKFLSQDNLPLIEFDRELKQVSPNVYDMLGEFRNHYGWRYIKQWREWRYSRYTPSVVLIRIRHRCMQIMGRLW